MDRMELFARIQLEQEETILLIIDIQTKLMAAMDARDQVCQNTGILLTTARELQIPVVVTEQYPRGLGPSVPELVQQLPRKFGCWRSLLSMPHAVVCYLCWTSWDGIA